MSIVHSEKNKQVQANAIARSNFFVMLCHLIEVSIISIAYIFEFVKHARPLWYVLLTIAIGFAAPIAEIICYKLNKQSNLIKHMASIGFGAFYTFICFTTNNQLAFVYAIPMLILILCFNDAFYSLRTAIACTLVNIGQVVFFLATGVYTLKDNSAAIEIQILVMILIGCYCFFASKLLQKNNNIQLSEIERQGNETEKMLDNILSVSGEMTEKIEFVGNKMTILKDTVSETKDAMGEVNSGSTDTAEAVQRQLLMTENISDKIEGVAGGTAKISESVTLANEALEDGSANIEGLVAQMEESIRSGKEVSYELEQLSNSMEQIKAVIDIINAITGKTGLLALNASIEAARAGEAGRGFAVVASEISQMANDTKEATARIQAMVTEFEKTITNVVTVTGGMVSMIDEQHAVTGKAADSFRIIADNTAKVSENSRLLGGYVEELTVANKEIVDSISTISAISEEVAAHSNNTYTISEQNMELVSEVYEYTEKLKELAESLTK